MTKLQLLCPCCSSKTYQDCCEPFIAGQKTPKSAEQLMRSRYTAYTQANIDYIEQTMRGVALEKFNKASSRQWAQSATFLGLEVVNSGLLDDPNKAFVEFKAFIQGNSKKHCMHEKSHFERIDNRWYYTDAEQT